jgi:hypothetical protein
MSDRPQPATSDLTGGWQVGQRVKFRPRLAFDTRLHRGTIVAIAHREPAHGRPAMVDFTVEIDPADGAGRVQLNLAHLYPLPAAEDVPGHR